MDYNDFEGQQYSFSGGTYYSSPRWNDFSLDDERRARRRFSRFFLCTAIYILLCHVILICAELSIVKIFGEERFLDLIDTTWFALVMNSVIMYALAFPVLFFTVKGMKNTVRFKDKISFKEFISMFLVAEAFMYVGNIIGNYLNLFIGAFIGKTLENDVSSLVLDSNIWIVILFAVLIGPIFEELIFRKLLMDKLGIYGDRVAIFVSAIAFGLFHGNLYQFFYAAMIGFVLAYIYSKTANIWYPIAIHMLVNFFGSVIPLLLSDKFVRYEEILLIVANGSELTPELTAELGALSAVVGAYSFLTIGMVIAGAVIFFKKRRQVFVSDRAEVPIPKERRVSVILCNVGSISYVVLCGLLMLLSILL